jgi:hypothetical protein
MPSRRATARLLLTRARAQCRSAAITRRLATPEFALTTLHSFQRNPRALPLSAFKVEVISIVIARH